MWHETQYKQEINRKLHKGKSVSKWVLSCSFKSVHLRPQLEYLNWAIDLNLNQACL